ncbi:dihydrolipoamide acetyltransferase component of pyruvate dehydrogenase complex [Dictyobacter vulcani]|uniref:Dihydrolipoamide acetyltransferase component of pyruvate dehydrogenase complex n=1 Tax=Dictyobacter vulcani TaxID=2607529 RepID=A0A5J4KIH2_9CHLR|nr:dihydrolipoamide acetyltransferase family protein [Dictyobacter vulcani]GER89254.1 dihydrolipoamide acetyltransferase component of pyruvate dehydrogenase complex [Dictyobacter vulcani]
MPTSVTMPRLGESVAEGTIGAWLKQEGDLIERDESLAEVITDKINAELPSPVAGRLVKILIQADETVPVGTEIALIEESADVASEGSPAGPDAAPVDSVQEAKTPLSEPQYATGVTHANGANGADGRKEDEERQRISPLARRLAREHDVDLNEIAGTGAGGRVRKEDILAYVDQRQNASVSSGRTPAVAAAPVAPAPKPAPVAPAAPTRPAAVASELTASGDEIIVPSRMRMAIAEHMVRSKRTSPHATTVVEIDMTNITRWLAKNKEEFKRREGYGISYVPFVMKAVCEGIRKFPIINSTWTEDNKIIIKRNINLGMAVSTDTGLVVPTIYDADQFTLAGLAKQVNALAQRARANKLTVQDMQNSTFVVNNPGVFGTIISMPIINQPHAGILSMDAVVKRPVVIEDDAIAVRSMMFMCLSFDHRLLDGAGAGGFLQAVRTKLQSYGRDIDVY